MIEFLSCLGIIAFVGFLHALPFLGVLFIIGCGMDQFKSWWKN